ncbi:MAG: methionyl-tRNA formyltransferase [Acidimicrobiales bacterium]|jgi:methionyl-tRNA formyltransferase
MARLAFLGSPEAAVPALRALTDAGHDVVVVVSQPDRRRGRGAGLAPSPVKQAALEMGLGVTDRIEDVPGSGAELGVVVAYGRIVPTALLERTPMLNAHFSLLPRWRGAAPVERAILAGDQVTGVSIMRLEATLDTGPVLVVRREPIDNAGREHASALTNRLSVVAGELLVEVLSKGVAMLGPGTTQVGEATYAAKVDLQELRLDFSRTVAELERIVRLDRAWTTFRGVRLRVLDAVGHDEPATMHDEPATASEGRDDSSGLTRPEPPPSTLRGTSVQAADGTLELLVVQQAGRRPQAAGEWLRGARPLPGERLGE